MSNCVRILLGGFILAAGAYANSQQPATSQATSKGSAQIPTQTTKDLAISQTSTADQKVAPTMKTGYVALSSKDYVETVKSYQFEVQQAQARGDHKAEADMALKRAQALDNLSGLDPGFSGEAVAAYRQAIVAAGATGDRAQGSLAANNLAVLLLKQGKVEEAGEAAHTIDVSAVPANQRAVFQFNIGRVQELKGNAWDAYQQYSAASFSNPALTQAWEGAFRTLGKQQPPALGELAKLSDRAITSGWPEIASEQLVKFLTGFDNDQLQKAMAALNYTPQRLLDPLLRSYAAQGLTPALFRTHEAPLLKKVAESHDSLVRVIKDVEMAYLGKLAPGSDEAAASFSSWRQSQEDRQSLGAVLLKVADSYADLGEPEMAVGRYGAAWEIANEPRCAVQYSALMGRNPKLDPDGRFVERLIDEVFIAKGQHYMRGDWPHILPLHIALGTIFEEQKKWGDPGDPRGAQFQWLNAIIADGEVRKRDPSLPPSPGLHGHLGNVYKAIGRKNDAIKEFLTAGLGFLDTGDRVEAHRYAVIIQEMSPGDWAGFSADDRAHWETLAREAGTGG